MTVKEEFQSIGKKLDEIRELLVNGPKQDSADLGQSETSDDQFTPVGWDDEVGQDRGVRFATVDVGEWERLVAERNAALEQEETLRSERDHFIERCREQGARLSEAKDERDKLQDWVNELQAERNALRSERDADQAERSWDVLSIRVEEYDELRSAKEERDRRRDECDKLGKECQALREQVNNLRKARDAFHDQANKLVRERDGETARADQAEHNARMAIEDQDRLRNERDEAQDKLRLVIEERDIKMNALQEIHRAIGCRESEGV